MVYYICQEERELQGRHVGSWERSALTLEEFLKEPH